MGTALRALCFCALSLVLALFVGISPISDKAKIRFMYVGAALSLIAVPMMSVLLSMQMQPSRPTYISSAFFKIEKKRKSITLFLCIVFEAYFPGGERFVYKKMSGAKG